MPNPDIRTVETYLVLEKDGSYYRPPRVVAHRKNKPSLESGQIAVKVRIAIPMSMFDTFIPVVAAEVVDDKQVILPEMTIEPEVTDG